MLAINLTGMGHHIVEYMTTATHHDAIVALANQAVQRGNA